jgi:hypothetical protein
MTFECVIDGLCVLTFWNLLLMSCFTTVHVPMTLSMWSGQAWALYTLAYAVLGMREAIRARRRGLAFPMEHSFWLGTPRIGWQRLPVIGAWLTPARILLVAEPIACLLAAPLLGLFGLHLVFSAVRLASTASSDRRNFRDRSSDVIDGEIESTALWTSIDAQRSRPKSGPTQIGRSASMPAAEDLSADAAYDRIDPALQRILTRPQGQNEE